MKLLIFGATGSIGCQLVQQALDQGIATMQAINITVINPWFMTVFLGTAVICLVLAIATLFKWSQPGAAYLLVASLLYLIGSFGVTMVFNTRWSFQNSLKLNCAAEVWRGNQPVVDLDYALRGLSDVIYQNWVGDSFTFEDMIDLSYTDGMVVMHHDPDFDSKIQAVIQQQMSEYRGGSAG